MFIANSYTTSTTPPRQLLILGLSTENRARLEDGKPIKLSRETHGVAIPANLDLILFAGDTEDSMADDLKDLIAPDTVVGQKRPL